LKVSFIVPTRNKAAFVERAANSYLRQTRTDFELVFFDQRSTDGTREILRGLVDKYDGPVKMRLLACPDNSAIPSRAAAMNADINWVHGQIEGDVILWGNADDFAYPTRVEKTVAAFEEFKPSWVSCSQYIMSPDLRIITETVGGPTRRIGFAEGVQFQVGSSGALAYARDLWEKHGPMRGIEQNDIVLPVMSFLERGMVYVGEVLQAFVQYADAENQGISGRISAATTSAERGQLEETNAFNLSANWMSVLTRLAERAQQIDPGAMGNINAHLWAVLQTWVAARERLTLEGVRPLALHGKP
jgi:glycosyltransferase involved in cell wall biosynthesis